MTLLEELKEAAREEEEEQKKQYKGYGYHGGGRKATGVKRVSICISGQPEEIQRLKDLAAENNKTVSQFILEKTGVKIMNKNNWFVTNNNGDVAGHDLSETKAKLLAQELRDKKTFYIEFYHGADTGYVSDEEKTCISLDFAMTFDNEEEAEEEKAKMQEKWPEAELLVKFINDDSWEALSSDEE